MTAPAPEIPGERRVASPGEFEQLIRELVSATEAGLLVETSDGGAANPRIDVKALLGADTWPDIVDVEFVDRSGGRYRLFVDTYHGVGGRWSRLEE